MEPKIAIVADTMVVLGGAERLIEVLAEAFPTAPIYALLYDSQKGPQGVQGRVTTSWLSIFPGATRYAKALLPFYPSAIESFDLSDYDIIVSSNHTLAKGILRTADQLHISYCHTPMRAIWERTHAEVQGMPSFVRPLLRNLFFNLRIWDFVASARVDQFIANSRVTQQRIATHYRRDSLIVAPPIDTMKFYPTPSNVSDSYYLVAARNVPYKRIDLAISAAETLGRRLIVVGEGTDRLRSTCPLVECRGQVKEDEFVALMQGARAFLAPQLEDFGMAMLEASACAIPVLAYGRGGALDSVIDGKTGVLFREQNLKSLIEGMLRFESLRFDRDFMRRHAEGFSKKRFIENIHKIVFDTYKKQQEKIVNQIEALELMATALSCD